MILITPPSATMAAASASVAAAHAASARPAHASATIMITPAQPNDWVA
jgi:hypothetical protein